MTIIAADDRRRWYALQTKPKQEARAEWNLRHWKIETLAPTIATATRHRDGRVTTTIGPLFPNYIFARFDAQTLGAKVRLVRGVQRIVGLGEYATPIDDPIIELIRSRMDEQGLVREPELRPGDHVEVVDGALEQLTGVFERHLPARDRVVVLLSTIASCVRVELPAAAVRRIA